MPEPVLITSNPACIRHDTGPEHPESAARLLALEAALAADRELSGTVVEERAAPASEQDLLRVHGAAHVERVRSAAAEAARTGGRVWLEEDTPVSAGSWEAALAAAGCAIAAAERVADGRPRRAFALARPPGHHASADRAMGFCLFDNAAVAARRLVASGRVRRVLVADADAHHGNGTQDIFYEDPSVYFLSLHLSPDYPWTGAAGERGAGAGLGKTRNIPLPRGADGGAYRARWAAALDEALAEFSPELVILSLGLDVLAGDPEGGFALVPRDLHGLVTDLLDRLPPQARGRVVTVLEGGYALDRIGAGFVEALRALAGLPPSSRGAR
ncbi:histone deacetylase family protein [Anaeromyxobacter diazotrophicus]|uniref:Histone deacetylase n=1 Tax=Anaeromyxobacter diazotrophicus TaxID=2590199 RepID=A0A7I9VHZ7_9BACT|nr:histone deacetylase [Anaeromyxobacter diazotrophicus]GEJ56014.1 histone deacetylase [Anaeromyxobacter diazotrophicus]